MTIDELIAALEKAEGPDWHLDEAIATRAADADPADHDAANWPIWPPYTASIDSALTLVPEAFEFWHLSSYSDGRAGVAIYATGCGRMWSCEDAATPALALCIAALKARAAA